jgi:hypothetical protein
MQDGYTDYARARRLIDVAMEYYTGDMKLIGQIAHGSDVIGIDLYNGQLFTVTFDTGVQVFVIAHTAKEAVEAAYNSHPGESATGVVLISKFVRVLR